LSSLTVAAMAGKMQAKRDRAGSDRTQ
jgi:hypothetical protein